MISVSNQLDLSIIIVNYNTKDLVLECIGSLYKSVKGVSFEVLVVDNASSDGSVDAVFEHYPAARIIKNLENMGFARANNQGIRAAGGRYIVLLNSDTVMTEMALETIVGFMDSQDDVAICGGQLLNADGSLQNSIANIPNLATELLNKSLLRRLFPNRYIGKEIKITEPREVESIIGACMVVSRRAIDLFGMLDEKYFFFFEETDWCLTMKKGGWHVFFHPGARIYHLQGASAKKNIIPARIEYWKSRCIFFSKHYPVATYMFLRAALMVRLLFSLFFQGLMLPFSSSTRSRFMVNFAILRWHLHGCPTGWGIAG